MAVIQISRIQHRRGLEEDIPQLASAELGWCTDTRRLFIGNGTVDELSPVPGGRTELLTEFSIIDFEQGFAANITTLEGNVLVLESNIASLEAEISAISTQTEFVTLDAASSGTVFDFASNNLVVSYTLTQGSVQRIGTIHIAADSSTVDFSEDYNETGTTDITFTVTGTSTAGNLEYVTTTATELSYRLSNLA